jgi:hypothetical protein
MSYSRRELYAFGEPLGESVTRKESGRIIYGGGGGGGGGGSSAPKAPPPPPPPPPRMASAAPPPAFTTYGQGDRTGSMVQSGNIFRPSTLDYSRPIYDPNYADNITGYQQSSQFFQPVYNTPHQNYSMGNPMSISQYGQQPFYGGGYGGGFGQQMQSPFSFQQQPMQQAQPNYGPSQAIVGRSSQMRGTPSVMRRAEGGIASLMDDVE